MTFNTGMLEKAMCLTEEEFGILPGAGGATTALSFTAGASQTTVTVGSAKGFTAGGGELVLLSGTSGSDVTRGAVVKSVSYATTELVCDFGYSTFGKANATEMTATEGTAKALGLTGENWFKYFDVESLEFNIDNQMEEGRGLNALPFDTVWWDGMQSVTGSFSGDIVDPRGLYIFVGHGDITHGAVTWAGDLASPIAIKNTPTVLPSFSLLLQLDGTDGSKGMALVRGVKFSGVTIELSKDSPVKVSGDWSAKCIHVLSDFTVPDTDNAGQTSPKCKFTWMDASSITIDGVAYAIESFSFSPERALIVQRPIQTTEPARSVSAILEEKWITAWSADIIVENETPLFNAMGAGPAAMKRRDEDVALSVALTGKPSGASQRTITISSVARDSKHTAQIKDIKRALSTDIETRVYSVNGTCREWSMGGAFY